MSNVVNCMVSLPGRVLISTVDLSWVVDWCRTVGVVLCEGIWIADRWDQRLWYTVCLEVDRPYNLINTNIFWLLAVPILLSLVHSTFHLQYIRSWIYMNWLQKNWARMRIFLIYFQAWMIFSKWGAWAMGEVGVVEGGQTVFSMLNFIQMHAKYILFGTVYGHTIKLWRCNNNGGWW